MKIGSLFDGIGGWPLAAVKFGAIPVWASEIEAFPIKVTQRHFPNMKHLGDITGVHGYDVEPVDVICMGSPCQDLSIAGKREGLTGARSGLFMDAVRIVREMREATNGKYPRFVVWENVPGAFSSNKGNDFRAVLEEITESKIPMPRSNRWAKAGMVRSNGCEVAWRTLDAQYWGVPQRRKRIFLVADFGCKCAGEILFKPESVSGDIAEGRGEGERIAGSIADSIRATVVRMRSGCAGGGKGALVSVDKSLTIAANTNDQTLFVPIPINCMHEVSEDKCIVEEHYKVRHITPTECERLQGLPDGYTLIDDKKCSDSARYKALGNGMAQPCADFVMQRIVEVSATKDEVGLG